MGSHRVYIVEERRTDWYPEGYLDCTPIFFCVSLENAFRSAKRYLSEVIPAERSKDTWWLEVYSEPLDNYDSFDFRRHYTIKPNGDIRNHEAD